MIQFNETVQPNDLVIFKKQSLMENMEQSNKLHYSKHFIWCFAEICNDMQVSKWWTMCLILTSPKNSSATPEEEDLKTHNSVCKSEQIFPVKIRATKIREDMLFVCVSVSVCVCVCVCVCVRESDCVCVCACVLTIWQSLI